jgi:hypothetical protein
MHLWLFIDHTYKFRSLCVSLYITRINATHNIHAIPLLFNVASYCLLSYQFFYRTDVWCHTLLFLESEPK